MSIAKKVIKILDGHKLNYRSSGGNWIFNCPFCGDVKQRLGVHKEEGKYQCFNDDCDIRGRKVESLDLQLKKLDGNVGNVKSVPKEKSEKKVKINQKLADKYHKNLKKKDRDALNYLKKKRGFSKDTIDHFKLGSRVKKGYEAISVPYFENGKLVNLKYRSIDKGTPKKYKWMREEGGKSALFNNDILNNLEINEITIFEAEMDEISAYNAGVTNSIAVTVGAKGFKADWYDILQRFERVYICFDNDEAGQDGAEKFARRIGLDKCWNIVLPRGTKDANEYFWDKKNKKHRHTLKDFKKLMKKAKQWDVASVLSLGDIYKKMYKQKFLSDEDAILGYDSPWNNVNTLIKGVKPGYFVVIAGKGKSGKTTCMVNWFMYLAKQDVPVFLIECEIREERLGEKTIQMYKKDFVSPEDISTLDIQKANFEQPTDKFYYYYPQYEELDLDSICEKIKDVVKRHGCKVVCFDNKGFLARGSDTKDQVGLVTRRFKMLAENLNIVMFMIDHPRKTNNSKIIKPDDLKDSNSTFHDLDLLMIVHREETDEDSANPEDIEMREGNFSDLVTINVMGRYIQGGQCYLYFNGERSLFKDKGMGYSNEIQKIQDKVRKKRKKNRRER